MTASGSLREHKPFLLFRADDLGSGVQATAGPETVARSLRGHCQNRGMGFYPHDFVRSTGSKSIGENLERSTASATKTATGETATTAKASPSTPT